jgi:hypothetical protein
MVYVRKQRKKHSRGLEIVEVAVLSVVMFPILLGAMKYGWLFYQIQKITNATRHGARLAILPGKTTDEVKQAMVDLLDEEGIHYIEKGDIVCTPSLISDANLGDAVTVEIFIDPNDIDLISMHDMLPKLKRFKTSVTMAKEGF